MAMPICFMLFWHWDRWAASRTFCTAGTSRAMRTAMMAMTTSSSIKVKPVRLRLGRSVISDPRNRGEKDNPSELLSLKGEERVAIRGVRAALRSTRRHPSGYTTPEHRDLNREFSYYQLVVNV